MELWAIGAQDDIASLLSPYFLKHYKKKNLRSLTAKQQKESEFIKFGVLTNIEPYSKIEGPVVLTALNAGGPPQDMLHDVDEMIEKSNKKLTLQETRNIQATAYAFYNGEDDG